MLFPSLVVGAAESAQRLPVTAPFDGTPIDSLPVSDADDVERALATAYALYRNRDAWLSAAQRIEILNRAADIVDERAEQIALESAREGGKPLIDSRVEVARAIDGLRNCVEVIRNNAGHAIPMGINAASEHRLAVTRREPIGVVVAVSAFNHPVNLIVHQVGPAVASGCPVIVKPAEDTPLSCWRIVQILHEAGLPQAWAQALVVTDLAVAEKLVTDSRVGFFSFIGSSRVGWHLRSKLAPGTRCALEHGGVAPVIVAKDANVDDMLPLLAKGGFYHAGQVCVSVQRIFVHRSRAREVAERLAELAKPLVVGDPTSADTEIGPLIRPREVERVASWVDSAVSAGAELLCGGKALSETCYAPTVLFNPPADTEISRQEVFGPVVAVFAYDDMDDAIAQANDLPFSFQASVFSADIDTAMRATDRLDASAVMINDHTAFRVDWMPFAGLKQSGLGVGGIPHTFEDMQVEKLIVLKSSSL